MYAILIDNMFIINDRLCIGRLHADDEQSATWTVRSQVDGKRPSRALEESRRSRRQGRNADYSLKWISAANAPNSIRRPWGVCQYESAKQPSIYCPSLRRNLSDCQRQTLQRGRTQNARLRNLPDQERDRRSHRNLSEPTATGLGSSATTNQGAGDVAQP